MMHTDFLLFRSSRVAYRQWGGGPRLLLCFHGYGEESGSFGFLEESLGADFTLLAIDLPFHGETDWKEGALEPDDLLSMVREITSGWPAALEPWWLLGYSMGGRIALSLTEKIPGMVAGILLVAPDGLVVNPWYWLATQTSPGNWLFRLTMRYPGWFFFILRIGNFLKIVNPSVYKFTRQYIGNRVVRRELYLRWTAMRKFRPHLPALQKIIREHRIRLRLLFGRYDRIIRWERGRQFIDGIQASPPSPYIRLEILPQGHQLLHPRNLDTILSLLHD
jgi:pimeloyl-ACP methyl ester carboxylesterase